MKMRTAFAEREIQPTDIEHIYKQKISLYTGDRLVTTFVWHPHDKILRPE